MFGGHLVWYQTCTFPYPALVMATVLETVAETLDVARYRGVDEGGSTRECRLLQVPTVTLPNRDCSLQGVLGNIFKLFFLYIVVCAFALLFTTR